MQTFNYNVQVNVKDSALDGNVLTQLIEEEIADLLLGDLNYDVTVIVNRI